MTLALRFAVLMVAVPLTGTAAALVSGARSIPTAPAGFTISVIAHVPHARELAATANGDLLVGTTGSDIYIVPDADGHPGEPHVFASVADREAAGVTLGPGALYVGSTHGVWRVAFKTGDRTAEAPLEKIATLRGASRDGSHATTSVAVAGRTLFASVGSSCNACEERDPTRATIQSMSLDGRDGHAKAIHMRNAVALAANPDTNALWAGVAGQDELAHGHPYEMFDDVTAHAGTVDYGWPHCFENRQPVEASHNCADAAISRVYFPAYTTPIGAAIYPVHPRGAYAFPDAYRGGAFVALHGSWHQPLVAPRLAFVPLRDDEPLAPVDWNDPTQQWMAFLDGFQTTAGVRIGRPTGVAVGADGSLFVADDDAGVIYRIRPKN